MPKTLINSITSFSGLGIGPHILSVLARLGLETPTPIQAKAIPVAIKGQDLIGIAQTGTGKTLAFAIPLIQRLAEVKGQALVLLPTRELANQVEESIKKVGQSLGLRTVSIIGGEAISRQLFALKRHPHVIIATPGRLLDHIKRKTIKLDTVSILVLDEADMMFDLGFAPQIEEIIKLTPQKRQTLLFSATMPAPIIRLAERYLSSPLKIEVAPAGSTVELVDQEIYLIRREDRISVLEKILKEYKDLVLIFVRTKHGAANLADKLKAGGQRATEIHSNLSFGQRKTALVGFKSGMQRILVATDVAARGLDINDIQLVLNFDLPDNCEDYVHRIGRTARAGKGGKAISFALPNQLRDIQKIERLIKKNLPLQKIGSAQGEIVKTAPINHRANNRYGARRPRVNTAPDFSDFRAENFGYGGKKQEQNKNGIGKRFKNKKRLPQTASFSDRPKTGGAGSRKQNSRSRSTFTNYKSRGNNNRRSS